jgi:hypothetical protein
VAASTVLAAVGAAPAAVVDFTVFGAEVVRPFTVFLPMSFIAEFMNLIFEAYKFFFTSTRPKQ